MSASVKGFAKVIIVITTIMAAVMELVDTSIINVALNDMSGSLGVNIEDIGIYKFHYSSHYSGYHYNNFCKTFY